MTTVSTKKSEATKYTLFKTSIEDIFDSEEKLNDIAKKWTENRIIDLDFENMSYPEWDAQIRKLAHNVLGTLIDHMTQYFTNEHKNNLSQFMLRKAIDEEPGKKNLYELITGELSNEATLT